MSGDIKDHWTGSDTHDGQRSITGETDLFFFRCVRAVRRLERTETILWWVLCGDEKVGMESLCTVV